ncbi:MAG: YtzC family protein [Bacillus sp. (in: Bacteria)]|nr:YtzC family protein [Bacillus sp. (in: firmicutes)]
MVNSNNLENVMEQIQQVLEKAEDQLTESKRNESVNAEAYTNAQLQLEEANMELERMIASATRDQRDELFRLQQQLHQLQNRMILGT